MPESTTLPYDATDTRGNVLRLLMDTGALPISALAKVATFTVLADLLREGLIEGVREYATFRLSRAGALHVSSIE